MDYLDTTTIKRIHSESHHKHTQKPIVTLPVPVIQNAYPKTIWPKCEYLCICLLHNLLTVTFVEAYFLYPLFNDLWLRWFSRNMSATAGTCHKKDTYFQRNWGQGEVSHLIKPSQHLLSSNCFFLALIKASTSQKLEYTKNEISWNMHM
jgi:hypothetical protein